jgi:hypothetical protein
VPTLTVIGIISLALGAASGWPLALLSSGDITAARLRLKEPKRLLQIHLDWIMMGILLLAVAAALPTMPGWIGVLIVIGAIGNPLLFIPLAVKGSGVRRSNGYRVTAAGSFLSLTGGLAAAAVWAL